MDEHQNYSGAQQMTSQAQFTATKARCEKLEHSNSNLRIRVKALESALKNARDSASKDRPRYEKEVERWKAAYNKSQQSHRRHNPQIDESIHHDF